MAGPYKQDCACISPVLCSQVLFLLALISKQGLIICVSLPKKEIDMTLKLIYIMNISSDPKQSMISLCYQFDINNRV